MRPNRPGHLRTGEVRQARPTPFVPGPDQESVWDYPRPPRLEPARARLRVVFDGEVIADTRRGLRVLETSHPPTYYIPMDDVIAGALGTDDGRSICEWKGEARYFTVRGPRREAHRGAWGYEQPTAAYPELTRTVAFYPALMDRCLVDDEVVTAQPGGFYGGWVTSTVVGPFKGEPGSHWW